MISPSSYRLPASPNFMPPVPARHLPRERGEALRLRRLDRIRTHIDAALAEPDLSAQTAARALGMSVRSLHFALAPDGESFGQLVLRRRLAACHALLRRPDDAASIAEIAFACGFNSLSSFYRAFRQAFGTCPRDLRADDAAPATPRPRLLLVIDNRAPQTHWRQGRPSAFHPAT